MRTNVPTFLPALAAVATLSGAVVAGPALLPGAAAAGTTVVVAASADAFTQQAAPSAHRGTGTAWAVDGRNQARRRAFARFALPTLPTGTTIASATMSAYVIRASASIGTTPRLYRTSVHWSETTLTWKNQPALGLAAAAPASFRTGTWVSWNVTPSLTSTERSGGVQVSFAVATGDAKWLTFATRESGRAPRLTLTTSTAPAPGSTEAAALLNWGPVVAGDEFSYVGAPDSTRWSVYNSAGHGGNGLRRPSAWNVDGGVVTVTGDSVGTTGGMSAKFDRRQYGRWETRMRTNARDPKYHPVLILWPDAGSGTTCPEIDYAEGSKDTTVMSFYDHYGCGGVQTYAKKVIDTTQWHNYAVEWTPSGVVGYIDGVEGFRDTNPAHQPPGSMHQTIQLDWFPDGTATTTSWMQVDWVRVYNS